MLPVSVPKAPPPILIVPALGLKYPRPPEMLVNEKALFGVMLTPVPSSGSPGAKTVNPVNVKFAAGEVVVPPWVIVTPPLKLMSEALAVPAKATTAKTTRSKVNRFIF
jgi:hypothetical protein